MPDLCAAFKLHFSRARFVQMLHVVCVCMCARALRIPLWVVLTAGAPYKCVVQLVNHVLVYLKSERNTASKLADLSHSRRVEQNFELRLGF
eukprot:scaffold88523_cov20-Tisochrysis_lutea.AAC.2